ncbi:MAG: isoprenylcysteine carboxylmethyltransferase family protein [Gammaproteobacteria bacterium]|nr:isoprenylcysteine carboxylmethyltransferase family protein [Gammaproteobacteria bacterium]
MRVRMIPAAWLLLAIVAMVLADKYFPIAEYSLPAAKIVGNILFALSVLTFVTSAWQFHKSETTVDPLGEATSLITGGPFRISRNPIYLAMVFLLCGLALRMGSATPWPVIAAFIWVIQTRQIAREEQQLAARFSDVYADYCRRVRRWL